MMHLSQYLPQIKIDRSVEPPKVFCALRKKWLVLTPEEVVRQSVIHHLIELGYPIGRISVEKKIKDHVLNKRYDLVVYDRTGKLHVLVECKGIDEAIFQSALDQVSAYNYTLASPIIWITNGHHNRMYRLTDNKDLIPIELIPSYNITTYLEEE